jgi:integrase
MQKLTEAVVEALPIDGRDYIIFDSGAPGFGIRVTPAGKKIFVAQARLNGRPRRVSVGVHPASTVVKARAAARLALEALRAGRDPALEREARQRAREAGQTTVAEFAETWLREHVALKRKPRTLRDYRRLFEQRIKPKLGNLIVERVTKQDVLQFHAELATTPVEANRAASAFRAMMSYAEDMGLRPPMSNPARRVALYRERARERFLSEDEIGSAAAAIDEAEREGVIGPHAAAGLRLALLTGARSGEIAAVEWKHVDWERRLIRLPDSKGNEPRTIHLSEAALEVLKTVPRVGPYVIAGAKPNEPYKNLSRAWIVTRKRASLDDVRLHDLRHSYASLAAGRGVSLHIIGKLLGHRVPATTQRYAHLARDVVAAINDELGAAMTVAIRKRAPADSGTVVKLRRSRAVKVL